MKNLSKIILPLILYFSAPASVQNSSNENALKEYEERAKKEHYEETINKFLPESESIRYMKDYDRWGVGNYWQTPQETDSLGTGDCEDKAIKAYHDLTKEGLELKLCRGKLRKDDEVAHVWNEYEIGNSTYIIETSAIDWSRIIKKDTINLNESFISLSLTPNAREKVENRINEFENRSGIDLKFKNFQ